MSLGSQPTATEVKTTLSVRGTQPRRWAFCVLPGCLIPFAAPCAPFFPWYWRGGLVCV